MWDLDLSVFTNTRSDYVLPEDFPKYSSTFKNVLYCEICCRCERKALSMRAPGSIAV
jgi:hypothetical protein